MEDPRGFYLCALNGSSLYNPSCPKINRADASICLRTALFSAAFSLELNSENSSMFFLIPRPAGEVTFPCKIDRLPLLQPLAFIDQAAPIVAVGFEASSDF